MNPQDGRDILQQQRWIQVQNAGGQDIPAYGVVEITGNTADDAEFNSFLSVRRPTRRGCPHILVNSHVPIAAGKRGWATRDYPVYALSESVGVGRMVGTAVDSFSLVKDVPGFTILGSGPTGTGTKRVFHHYVQCVNAYLLAELCPASSTASITGAEDCEILDLTTALNPYAMAGPAGAPIEITWLNAYQNWCVTVVKHRVWNAVTHIYGDPTNCAIIESRYKKMAGMWCESTTDEVAVQFFSSDVVVDLFMQDDNSGIYEICKLKQTKKTVCTLNDLSLQAGNITTAANFNYVEVLVNVRLNTTTGWIVGDTWYVFVPCDDPGRTVNLIQVTDCTSSS